MRRVRVSNQGDWPERMSRKLRPPSRSRRKTPPRRWLVATLCARFSEKQHSGGYMQSIRMYLGAFAYPAALLERSWLLVVCRPCACWRLIQRGRQRVAVVWQPSGAEELEMLLHLAAKASQLVLISKALRHCPLRFPSRQARCPFAMVVLSCRTLQRKSLYVLNVKTERSDR